MGGGASVEAGMKRFLPLLTPTMLAANAVLLALILQKMPEKSPTFRDYLDAKDRKAFETQVPLVRVSNPVERVDLDDSLPLRVEIDQAQPVPVKIHRD